MKIISCHIENFGKLHDYYASFTDGCNICCEENGWGKSTFAAFIRAMFYGLEGDKKRSSIENERKRYKPWQGGAFGGSMDFESSLGKFRVSRIFGDKEANDEFELRDIATNLISTAYSKDLGAELFGIDSESFMKTVFIGQNGCETAVTDDVNAKIGNLADNPQDMNCYETALKRLDRVLNALNPKRSTGSICARADKLQELERELRDSKELDAAYESQCLLLEKEESVYSGLCDELNANREQQKRVAELKSRIVVRNEYQRLEKELKDNDTAVESARSRFPAEVPDKQEVKDKIAECSELAGACERAESLKLNEIEEAELGRLTACFLGYPVPEENELEEKIKLAASFTEQREIMNRECLSSDEAYRLNELGGTFEGDLDVDEVIDRWSERCSKKESIPSRKAALDMHVAALEKERAEAEQKSGIAFAVIGRFVGPSAIIAGLVLTVLFGWKSRSTAGLTTGIILLVFGLFTVLVSILSAKRRQQRINQVPTSTPVIDELRQALENDGAFIEKVDRETADFLTRHETAFNENTARTALQRIFSEKLEYEKLRQKAQKAAASESRERVKTISAELKQYLERYGIEYDEQHYADSLFRLKERAGRLRLLMARSREYDEAAGRYDTLADAVCSFIRKYGFTPEDEPVVQLTGILDMVDDWMDAQVQRNETEQKLNRFVGENDVESLAGLPEDDEIPTSLEELNDRASALEMQLEEARKSISGYRKIIEEFREKLEKREENVSERDRLTEVQNEEINRHRLVSAAKERLIRAKETMTARYAEPLLERFGYYYQLITCEKTNRYHLDANTELTVDECGRQRAVEALSAGYRDLIGVSLRMSLVDAMYKDEKPMIVMDDPFTNLDDDKVKAAHRFLDDVAQHYQVLYFTCSRTRV